MKKNLEEKIETHCEQVMQEVVSNAGTAGRVVSQFVCIPDERGNYDDMLDIYFVREGLQDKLSTKEFNVSLEHLSVCKQGMLEYWLRVDVGVSEEPDRIGACAVTKIDNQFQIQWEYFCDEELEEGCN
jgi:hypothetical protein